MGPDFYVSVGKYSVKTDVPEVLASLGHCYSPTPSGTPVLVVRGDPRNASGVPDGTRVYSYPDHAGDLASLLGVEVSGTPDGSSHGEPAGRIFSTESMISIPESVTATQIRLWLFRNGITESMVADAINSITDEQQRGEAKIQWEYAPYVERSHPLVCAIGQYLGLSEPQIDAAFLAASESA